MKRFSYVEGSYRSNTSDDCQGRYYITDRELGYIDKRGRGMTRTEAIAKMRELNQEEKCRLTR